MWQGVEVAIVFELVVNFGRNAEAADRAAEVVRRRGPLHVGNRAIELHEPLRAVVDGDIELSVIPAGVGVNVVLDGDLPHVELTADELSELARGLYEVLAQFDGYRAAAVDWDPESLVECTDLEGDYGDQLVEGFPHGLVVAEAVRRGLSVEAAQHFERFAAGFEWIPYRGHGYGTY